MTKTERTRHFDASKEAWPTIMAAREKGHAICSRCLTLHSEAGQADLSMPWSCIPRCRIKHCHAVLILPWKEGYQ